MMFENYTSICELLVQAGLLEIGAATQALGDARDKGVTAGEYLTTCGGMKPSLVRAAIMSMLLSHDRLLPSTTGVAALKLMADENISFEKALEQTGFKKSYVEHVRLVCTLLERAGCITKRDREIAYEVCVRHELPIVQVLVKRDVINDLVGDVVLVLERLIVSDVLSFDQAIHALADARTRQVGADEALQAIGQASTTGVSLRLGELLLAAGIVSADDVLSAAEAAFYKKQFMGEVLVQKGLVRQDILNAVLEIQERINHGAESPSRALERLKRLRQGGS